MIRLLTISLAIAVGTLAAWSLNAKAQDLGEGLLRPMEPGAYKAAGGPRIATVLALTKGVLTATSVTTERHITAVRLSCSASCFVAVSASNGASMINFISGGLLSTVGDSIVYRSHGGDYVIGYSDGDGGSVYIQELTR